MKEPFAEYIEAELKPGFLLISCGLPDILTFSGHRRYTGWEV
jgi:hypothetical protein